MANYNEIAIFVLFVSSLTLKKDYLDLLFIKWYLLVRLSQKYSTFRRLITIAFALKWLKIKAGGSKIIHPETVYSNVLRFIFRKKKSSIFQLFHVKKKMDISRCYYNRIIEFIILDFPTIQSERAPSKI